MLDTLTAKANDAKASGFGAPIGAALRVLEGADDVRLCFMLRTFILFF